MNFKEEIYQMSGTIADNCFHCSCCSGGCQFSELMDYNPNQVNRLVQLGMKKEALSCSAIWTCVGCNTCSVQCPQAVDIPAIMDALREMAIREGVAIGDRDTLRFHEEMVGTIGKYGRSHKLEIMMRYKLAKMDLISDMNIGVKMLMKRKLDLTPSRIRSKKDLDKLFA